MSTTGVIHLGCPRCHTTLCAGIVGKPSLVRERYADNVSFCLTCRQWFRWGDADVHTQTDSPQPRK